MTARSIGDLAEAILARCVALSWLHDELRRTPCAADRKATILAARRKGQIDEETTTDLLAAYQLETA